jgi:hypothetical protein
MYNNGLIIMKYYIRINFVAEKKFFFFFFNSLIIYLFIRITAIFPFFQKNLITKLTNEHECCLKKKSILGRFIYVYVNCMYNYS